MGRFQWNDVYAKFHENLLICLKVIRTDSHKYMVV